MSVKKIANKVRKGVPLSTVQKIFFGIIIFMGLGTGFFISMILITFSELKDIQQLENYSRFAVPAKVYDVKNRLITEFYQEKREIISYKDLPEVLIKAIIAIEDQEFYSHQGVNYFAIIRALIVNIFSRDIRQGGSTITQQLAKSLFTSGEKNIFRKFIELWYAFQIEKKYSKEEILELYFNQIYFGHGCYGVQAATRFFFDKDVRDINLGEATLLAGIANAPSAFSPLFHPYRAKNRHKMVLASMVKMNYISQQEADFTHNNFWNNYSSIVKQNDISVQRSEKNYAPYFSDYVRTLMIEKYGEEKLYSSGYQIYTTLDLDKQIVAQNTLRKGLSNEQKIYDSLYRMSSSYYKDNYEDIVDMMSLVFGIDQISIGSVKLRRKIDSIMKDYDDIVLLSSYLFGLDEVNDLISKRYNLKQLLKNKADQIEGALISLDPQTGYIVAMVGGSSFNFANQFNRTLYAKRQMGSLFKPIYYAIGINERVITAGTAFKDEEITYTDAVGNVWKPRNYGGEFKDQGMTCREALRISVNVVSAQVWDLLLKTIGFDRVIQKCSEFFGLTPEETYKRVEAVLASSLGIGIFSPIEVAQSFSVFANDGIWVKPIAILRVKDRLGRVIDDFERERDLDKESRKVVMTRAAASIMQSMLSDVLFKGTGAGAAAAAGFSYPAGGKTGTAHNWKDAWFAGFTKSLTTVVWMGFDDARKTLGRDRAAALVAAPIWMEYMRQACRDLPNPNFYMPQDDVNATTICMESGLLAVPTCPTTYEEYFMVGTEPDQMCDIHMRGSKDSAIYQYDPSKVRSNPLDDLDLNIRKREKDPETLKQDSESRSLPDDENLGDLNFDNLDLNLD